jgi:hypothetical protein
MFGVSRVKEGPAARIRNEGEGCKSPAEVSVRQFSRASELSTGLNEWSRGPVVGQFDPNRAG